MSGAVELQPGVWHSPLNIAQKVTYTDQYGNKQVRWKAGPESKYGKPGQFISGEYVKRARAQREVNNDIRFYMYERDISEDEARDLRNKIKKVRKYEREIEQEDLPQDVIEGIQKKIDDIVDTYISP